MKSWHKGWTRNKWLAYKEWAERINRTILNRAKIDGAIQESENRED